MSPSKISRLPSTVREDLNIRLEQNVPGHEIADWLNSHPDVQPVLDKYYAGAPINEQNISTWRQGPFLEWQARQEFLTGLCHLTGEAADATSLLGNLTEHSAQLLSFYFLQRIASAAPRREPAPAENGNENENLSQNHPAISDADIKVLCRITRSIAVLRRGDVASARLKLREREVEARYPSKEGQPDPITQLIHSIALRNSCTVEEVLQPVKPGPSYDYNAAAFTATFTPRSGSPDPSSPSSVSPLCPSGPSVVNPSALPASEPEIKPYQAKSNSEDPLAPMTAADLPARFTRPRRGGIKPPRVGTAR